MANIVEKVGSRELTGDIESPAAVLRYTITDAVDEVEAGTLLVATLPAAVTVLGVALILQHWTIHDEGGGVWDAEASYGQTQPKEAGQSEFSFDTQATKEKRTHSLKTVEYIPSGAFPTDHKGGINVTYNDQGQPKVEGVDVPVRAFSFTVTRFIAHPISAGYAQALYEKSGLVNDDTVVLNIQALTFTFNPGELLFLGATGKQSGVEPWQIVLHCVASQNATGLVIGDIGGIDKAGHDYLWVSYEDDTDNNTLVHKPIQVNVEKVIERTTLAPLFA